MCSNLSFLVFWLDPLPDHFFDLFRVLHDLGVGYVPLMLHVGQGHPAGSVGCPLQHRLIYGPQSAGEAVGDFPQCADIIRQIRAEGVRVVPDPSESPGGSFPPPQPAF